MVKVRIRVKKADDEDLTLELDVAMHEPDTVHPPDSLAQLAPYPPQDSLA